MGGGNSSLYNFFHHIEHTEYLITALRVFKNHKKGLKIKYGKLLIGNVICNTSGVLTTKKHAEHPSIKKYLMKNSTEILNALDYIYKHYKKSKFNGLNSPDIDTSQKTWQSYFQTARITPAISKPTKRYP